LVGERQLSGTRKIGLNGNIWKRKLPKSLRNNGCGDLYYIFTRIHDTLRVSPATEAGIADVLWSMDDLVRRIGERFLPPAGPRGPYNKKTGSGIAATGGDDT